MRQRTVFDYALYNCHAVAKAEVAGKLSCQYACGRSIPCKYVGPHAEKHYHCLDCAHVTNNAANAREHAPVHDNARVRGVHGLFLASVHVMTC